VTFCSKVWLHIGKKEAEGQVMEIFVSGVFLSGEQRVRARDGRREEGRGTASERERWEEGAREEGRVEVKKTG
jgi:hypothetical protein